MRLLLVEDDPNMAEVLRRGLEEEGYSIIVAFDGHQGLEMAESCKLDGIILDVMLPKMDGLEVARRLRRNQNPTPILMLTACDTVRDVVAGLDKDADDYLTFSSIRLVGPSAGFGRITTFSGAAGAATHSS